MNNEDDPFLAVMSFLEGKSKKAVGFGAWLDEAFEKFLLNLYATVILLACAMLLLLLASSLMMASGSQRLLNIGAAFHVTAGLLLICHQLPYHSFILFGIPMAVCSRDVGIYLGSIAGFATVFLRERPKSLSSLKFVFLATIPIAIDGVTQSVLFLRESNNILRFITGLLFGFGVIAYLSNRIFLRWYPRFREHVWESRIIVADAVAVSCVLIMMVNGFGNAVGVDYLSRKAAVEMATADSKIPAPVDVESYYISSLSPLSIQADLFYENHRDLLLDDIRASDWAKARLQGFANRTIQPDDTDEMTPPERLNAIADRDHSLGIWAVAILSQEPVKGDSPYISQGSGEYYYYDALTGKLIMEKTH